MPLYELSLAQIWMSQKYGGQKVFFQNVEQPQIFTISFSFGTQKPTWSKFGFDNCAYRFWFFEISYVLISEHSDILIKSVGAEVVIPNIWGSSCTQRPP